MNLSTWNPFQEMQDMWDKYNRHFELPAIANKSATPSTRLIDAEAMAKWAPAVDIIENDKSYTFKVEIPAIEKDDVRIHVDNGVLKIEGERKSEKEDKGGKFHRVERFYGRFARSFMLPSNVEPEDVSAMFKDGLLTIDFKKSSEPSKKAIEIKMAS
jgi:HSP20 family protein